MKKAFTQKLSLAVLGLAMLMPVIAQAQNSGEFWMRSRAIMVAPSVSNNNLTVDVKGQAAPEFDFTYFVANNLSLELILAMIRPDITLNGGAIGSINVLPPTLTAQYHFKELLGTSFNPYIGVGLNWTIFFNGNLNAGGAALATTNSIAPAFEVGSDFPLTGPTFINVDVKKIMMSTDVSAAASGTVLDTLKINPWVFGLGLGVKF